MGIEFQEKYLEFLEERRNKNLGEKLEIVNYSMGLIGEASEISELIKKWYFQGHTLDRGKLAEELGDTFFYFMALLKIFEINLDEIMENNMDKLTKRYPNGFNKEDSIKRADVMHQ